MSIKCKHWRMIYLRKWAEGERRKRRSVKLEEAEAKSRIWQQEVTKIVERYEWMGEMKKAEIIRKKINEMMEGVDPWDQRMGMMAGKHEWGKTREETRPRGRKERGGEMAGEVGGWMDG